MRILAGLAVALSLAGCTVIPDARPPQDLGTVEVPEPVPADTALAAGVMPGPAIETMPFAGFDAAPALEAFRRSCDKILFREDTSGLTRRVDWQAPCGAATNWSSDPADFFRSQFETAVVADGSAFATGYYEPEILGSRERRPGYEVPVYAYPSDLERAWPADVPEEEREGRPPLGRYDENGEFVRYFERSEIAGGALEGKVPVIAWAADPVEFFFLQIQGSGLLRLPDGEVMRIGYAGQNGREYVAIGRPMREQGLIGEGTDYPTSMQGIISWLRDNPGRQDEILDLNKSWIFFRELDTEGPLGSIEVPVFARDSVAVDPKFVPYGAPVWLDMESDVADGLWIAQDTGGAIKGANRFDTFWGNGADARQIAGEMSSSGKAYLLLPKGTLARLKQ
ncbi:MltA domain-containing protein [Qipengyuania sp. 1NDW9]|uniref:murein transglycosylase A n=1 Tax=Qipengyuania xiapuensis TaxID=2867236 RepID=UPI001C86F7E4|nr:MltA domain-containing protein [Qipengyuania xiapuensis]MBX7494063.1 MltA domain-containing protein [Qipengyuania xiapuensis]